MSANSRLIFTCPSCGIKGHWFAFRFEQNRHGVCRDCDSYCHREYVEGTNSINDKVRTPHLSSISIGIIYGGNREDTGY